jgi:hypothetical protein
MLLPLAVYPTAAALVVARARGGAARAETALLGALLAYAVLTLNQAYSPMLLQRFLQTAVPFYALTAFCVATAAARLAAHGRPRAAAGLVASTAGAAALLVGLVLFGLPELRQPVTTGSARALRCSEPVEVLGETLYEEPAVAEEIAGVRAFFAERAPRGTPVLALNAAPLYNVLLERPNPTRFLFDHPNGDWVMTAAEKQREAERLIASPTTFLLASPIWYARTSPPDPLLRAARERFRPARRVGSQLILERIDAEARFGVDIERPP